MKIEAVFEWTEIWNPQNVQIFKNEKKTKENIEVAFYNVYQLFKDAVNNYEYENDLDDLSEYDEEFEEFIKSPHYIQIKRRTYQRIIDNVIKDMTDGKLVFENEGIIGSFYIDEKLELHMNMKSYKYDFAYDLSFSIKVAM